MKIYQSSTDYTGYSFPTVSLAYFLRYPNPYAKHVLSTDTLSQHIDPVTKRLHTLRLHLKRSKVPAGILKFLPKTMSGSDGSSQTYILERSVVDAQEGWMQTESRNMEWTGVLSVIEKQRYLDKSKFAVDYDGEGLTGTSCKTTVTIVSKLGENIRKRRKASLSQEATSSQEVEEEQPNQKQGWFAEWSKAGVQRTIELVGLKRTQTALVNSSKGMKVVMERLRSGGIKEVLEGINHDRTETIGGPLMGDHDLNSLTWRQVWQKGQVGRDGRDDDYD